MTDDHAVDTVTRLFAGYANGDTETVRGLLAEDLSAYVTNAEAGVDEVSGADDYMQRLPDLTAVGGSARVIQVLRVDDRRVMVMVEIRAERKGRALHNFATFLAEVDREQVRRLWMVEALPAYSDEFWS